jgi:anti-sigma-K factor RskA
MVAVLLNDANQPGAVFNTFADGRAELVPLGDMTIPHGAPVSVGVIQMPRTVRLNLDDLPQPRSNQLFAISVEPLAGSPYGPAHRPRGDERHGIHSALSKGAVIATWIARTLFIAT